jgi:predicted glycosyl hydrolase (DUF1957 family)
VKYHRITDLVTKNYDTAAAENAAFKHAGHFLDERRKQIEELNEFDLPILIAPFDAELFWALVVRRTAVSEPTHSPGSSRVRLSIFLTPSGIPAAHPTQQVIHPAASTWARTAISVSG